MCLVFKHHNYMLHLAALAFVLGVLVRNYRCISCALTTQCCLSLLVGYKRLVLSVQNNMSKNKNETNMLVTQPELE